VFRMSRRLSIWPCHRAGWVRNTVGSYPFVDIVVYKAAQKLVPYLTNCQVE